MFSSDFPLNKTEELNEIKTMKIYGSQKLLKLLPRNQRVMKIKRVSFIKQDSGVLLVKSKFVKKSPIANPSGGKKMLSNSLLKGYRLKRYTRALTAETQTTTREVNSDIKEETQNTYKRNDTNIDKDSEKVRIVIPVTSFCRPYNSGTNLTAFLKQ